MGRRRYNYNDDKEDPGSCCFCKKSFDTLSKFLRHVSHSKLCLEHHDPLLIKRWKEMSKLKSKRKWFHKNSNAKEEEQKKKSPTKEAKAKVNWYASNKMKQSDGGRGFYKLFEEIFEDCEKIVKSEMVKHYNHCPIWKELAIDATMDWVFGNFEATYHQLTHEYPLQEPDFVLDKAFEKLQSKFDEFVERDFERSRENWVVGAHDDMNTNLFHYSWTKALCDFYYDERFIAATKNAQDKALDTLFLNLIVTEGYFPDDVSEQELESNMVKVYTNLMEGEFVTQSNENGLSTELKKLMEKKWERKFNSTKFSVHDLHQIKIIMPKD